MRSLETLIRLSTAHAKARLSQQIEVVDANAAKELVQFALNNETDIEKIKKKKKAVQEEEADSAEASTPAGSQGKKKQTPATETTQQGAPKRAAATVEDASQSDDETGKEQLTLQCDLFFSFLTTL